MSGISLPTFVAWLRQQDKDEQEPPRPNTDALRQRELMQKATDAVADNLRHRWNTRMDAVTVHPSTDKE